MKKFKCFSLAEMMIVLLVVAIILAATAPIVSRKLSRQSRDVANLWSRQSAFDYRAEKMTGHPHLIINKTANGVISISNEEDNFGNKNIIFGNHDGQNNADSVIAIGFGTENSTGDAIALGNSAKAIGQYSMALGHETLAPSKGAIALGYNASTGKENSIVIGYKSSAKGNNTIAIGANTNIDDKVYGGDSAIVLGNGAKALANGAYHLDSTIVIGKNALSEGGYASKDGKLEYGGSIAIGESAKANDAGSIAIGKNAKVENKDFSTTNCGKPHYGIAIGEDSYAKGVKSIAIGYGAEALQNYATAIGNGAKATHYNEITLGNDDSIVYIPGTLVVGKTTITGYKYTNKPAYGQGRSTDNQKVGTDYALISRGYTATLACDNRDSVGDDCTLARIDANGDDLYEGSNKKEEAVMSVEGSEYNLIYHYLTNPYGFDIIPSDRRLKNVGEKYTSGLDALKKLELYNYTYKNDETKAPHVGVIAQDLQKVFPNSVMKDTSGYLKIRWDEMFYAVINAIKELDAKIDKVVADVTGLSDKIEQQQKTIDAQQKAIEDLTSRIEKLEKK